MIICPDFRLSGTLSFHPRESSILGTVIDKSDAKKKKLKQLCRTRWVERISSYENFWDLFAEVIVNIPR